MSIFLKIFGKSKEKNTQTDGENDTNKGISSYRYRGRWYGIMLILGEKSGRNMQELLKDKATEILTMLEISNEFPEDFKYVNMLIDLEKEKEDENERLDNDKKQKEYMLGAVEAKLVYLEGKKWDELLKDGNI